MEFNDFKVIMIGLSRAIPKYRVDFSDNPTLMIWFSSMQELDAEDLKIACRLAINTLDEFPSIRILKGLCKGKIQDAGEIGQDIANKIGDAINRFGAYRPDDAKEWLGELGWETVKRHGSWWDLCNIETYAELEHRKRDMKKTAESIYRNYEAFGGEKKLALPEKIDYETNPALRNALKLAQRSEI